MTPFTAAEFGRIADAVRNAEAGEFIKAVNESVDALRHAATLAGELERAKADAERYQWLRDNKKIVEVMEIGDAKWQDDYMSIDNLDEFIDAALKDRT